MYSIVETEENGVIYVQAAPKKWIENEILYWPNTMIVDRRNPQDIKKGVWFEYRFTMLKDNIGTYEKSLELEKFYSLHRNSESEAEQRAKKTLKRKHPVASHVSGTEIDVNDLFQTQTSSQLSTSQTVSANKRSGNNKHKSTDGGKQNAIKKKRAVTKAVSRTPSNNEKSTNSSQNILRPSSSSSSTTNFSTTSPSISSIPLFDPLSNFQTSTIHLSQNNIPVAVQNVGSQDSYQKATEECELTTYLTSNDTIFTLPSTSYSLDTVGTFDQNSPHVNSTRQTNSDDLPRKIVNEIGTMFQMVLEEVVSLKQFLSEERKLRHEMEARLQANLDVVVQSVSKNSKRSVTIDDKVMDEQYKLPICDWKTVSHFEKFLKQSPNFRENLTEKLSRIGGRNQSAKLHAVAKRIIADVALQQFTWKGTTKKDPFIQFTWINTVIKDAIHTDAEPYTDHHHNNCMKEYCKHATTRLNQKRRNKSNSKEIVNVSEANEDTETNDSDCFDDESVVSSGEENDDSDSGGHESA